MYTFQICTDRYLFVDLIIKYNILYCISTYYNDIKTDFKAVIMIVNDTKILNFTEEGHNECEPCRVISYNISEAKSYKINLLYFF